MSSKFLQTKESAWKNTAKLSDFLGHAKEYEAIFYVGGHGPMFDLATDETSHKLINEFYGTQFIFHIFPFSCPPIESLGHTC